MDYLSTARFSSFRKHPNHFSRRKLNVPKHLSPGGRTTVDDLPSLVSPAHTSDLLSPYKKVPLRSPQQEFHLPAIRGGYFPERRMRLRPVGIRQPKFDEDSGLQGFKLTLLAKKV